MPGFVKIAMNPTNTLFESIGPLTIHGTSDGKPCRNDNKVKLRRNPQFEGMLINCYVRMDLICVVPVSLLF
ncbi:hypothetical protein ABVK25_002000 [Lepraria finkii]|uniref:Uncharacterized protein n=1 Tax=Lepraria finkii TaxID=1340010 RepID=A0ABR4BL97_9LECA